MSPNFEGFQVMTTPKGRESLLSNLYLRNYLYNRYIIITADIPDEENKEPYMYVVDGILNIKTTDKLKVDPDLLISLIKEEFRYLVEL